VGKITEALEKFDKEDRSQFFHGKNKETLLHDLPGSTIKTLPEQNKKKGIDTLPDRSNPLKERLDKPLKGEDDSLSANNIHEDLITLLKPKTFEAEQFRMLKSYLLFPTSGKPPRSILVTSALPGEGKSFVASNLAISISQNINEYVLLTDCDIRKPTLHKNFGFSVTPGLSEYLSDNIPLSSLLLKTNINKLTILPAGKPPDNPVELLSSSKMSQLLEEIKTRYQDRYIIIDTPPPKLTSETQVIGNQVDAVILVVKYGSTPRKIVSDLANMFGKEKIIGVVFNMCSFKSTYNGYYKYGKYNHYYGTTADQ